MTPNYPLIKPFSHQERKENLKSMSEKELDLLIIGGGINGVWMALDARLRGLTVGLVEFSDFGHGPSRNNSELLHGGFRYLKEWYEHPKNWFKVKSVLHLVREALREREVLMHIAPHLARPVSFIMPLYSPRGLGWGKKVFYGFGFWMYDLLSAAQSIKPFQMLSRAEIIQWLDGIDQKNLRGGGLYYDCKMEPGRFVAEIIKAGHSAGALLANYTRAKEPIWDTDKKTILGFHCTDEMDQSNYAIRAKQIIDATGPWGDVFRHQIWPDGKRTLRLTKGIHIMVPQLFKKPTAVTFFSDDNRILFIIPWGEGYNYSLIGTTDTDYSKDPDQVAPDIVSIEYLVEKTRRLFPHADLTCYGNYAGVRPLVFQEGGSASSVTREHTILKHGESHLTSVFGGKWTTARVVASEVLDEVFPHLKGTCNTKNIRFGGQGTDQVIIDGKPNPDAKLKNQANNLGLSHETLEHLVFNYGYNAQAIMKIAQEHTDNKKLILENFPFIQAEVIFSIRNEMALRVKDFLIRRSIFGRLRTRGLEAAPIIARIMAKELGWNAKKQQEEVNWFDESTQIVN